MHVFLVCIFLLSLALPIIFFIGPLRLSPYRIILILLFVPCMFSWLSGRCGKIRSPDILILLYSIWASIALFKAHGLNAVEPAGIYTVETLGSYFLARCYIRSAKDYEKAIWIMLIVIAILIPFAFVESLTGRNILNEALSTVFNVPRTFNKEPRLGLQSCTDFIRTSHLIRRFLFERVWGGLLRAGSRPCICGQLRAFRSGRNRNILLPLCGTVRGACEPNRFDWMGQTYAADPTPLGDLMRACARGVCDS